MTKKLLTLLFSMLLIVSLSYSQGTTKEEKQLYERLMKSDSTLSKQELVLKYKIFELYTQIHTDGKKIYTNLKKEDFIKRDIPVFFYDDFIRGLEGFNKMISEGSGLKPEQVQAMVKRIKDGYSKMKKPQAL
ncbi:hypothetical protein MASR2M69_13590 [Bacteroidota bacterium]